MSLARFKSVDTSNTFWGEILNSIVQRCVHAGQVKKIFVFGSFSTKTMTEASDLDIAVIVADEENPREFRRRLPSPLAQWPLDLIIVRESRFNERKTFGGVLFDVNEDGIELYPRWSLEDHK